MYNNVVYYFSKQYLHPEYALMHSVFLTTTIPQISSIEYLNCLIMLITEFGGI